MTGYPAIFCLAYATEISMQYLLLPTDILQKTVLLLGATVYRGEENLKKTCGTSEKVTETT